jgi:hypothetical protein
VNETVPLRPVGLAKGKIPNRPNVALFTIFLLTCFLPGEVHVQLGTVKIELYRIILLIVSFRLVTFMTTPKPSLFEIGLFGFGLWSLLSFVVNHGVQGIQSGVIRILEVVVVYYWARYLVYIGGLDVLLKALKLLLLCFALLVPFVIYESQTGHRILHVIPAKILGVYTQEYVGYGANYRFGLFRSAGVFSHPILYSIIASSLLIVSYYYLKGWRLIALIGYVSALVFSVTSAGILMFALQLMMVSLEFLRRYIYNIRNIFFYGAILAFAGLELFTGRGAVKILVSVLAIQPHTAWTRIIQHDLAWDDVVNNPFFGIGFHEWTRPYWLGGSIDSYWLDMAVRHGICGVLLLITFWVGLAYKLIGLANETKSYGVYLMFSVVIALIFGLTTVSLFDRAQFMIYLIVGMFSGAGLYKKRQLNGF